MAKRSYLAWRYGPLRESNLLAERLGIVWGGYVIFGVACAMLVRWANAGRGAGPSTMDSPGWPFDLHPLVLLYLTILLILTVIWFSYSWRRGPIRACADEPKTARRPLARKRRRP
jgi:hypothetical protein